MPRASGPRQAVAEASTIVEHQPEVEELTDTEITAYDLTAILVDLDHLGPTQCKWAIREDETTRHHLFCGHPREKGKPYCSHHTSRARSRRQEVAK